MSSDKNPAAALFDAIEINDAILVRSLLAERAEWIHSKNDSGGASPLLYAIHKKAVDSGLALIELGADIEERAKSGYTPLLEAAAGCPSLVQPLLGAGANPKARSTSGHNFLACASLQPESLKIAFSLLGASALEDISVNGNTPLLVALDWGSEIGARGLLALGANPLAVNWENEGAAQMSANCKSLALLNDLIEAGADPLLRSYGNKDALVAFARNNRPEACRRLLSLGAVPTAVCEHGHGALTHALFLNQAELAEELVLAGAPLDTLDRAERSIETALKQAHREEMALLLPYLERVAEAARIKGAMKNGQTKANASKARL